MLQHIVKSWGKTDLIFDHNSIHIYYANIDKGKSCSKHYHRKKNNIIYVTEGFIQINMWDNGVFKKLDLKTGDIIDIPSGQWHQFIAQEASNIIEIYYYSIDHEDIIRAI